MASKSGIDASSVKDLEEALDAVDTTLDRLKTLYEQYFLGIQKQAPAYIHNEVERKLRDLTQLNMRNTRLRYRLATLQQKFGSYNSYWRRTLRQIENGTYLRNLAKIGRDAARNGAEIPEEILAAMPKRMREQVLRDRDQAIAIAKRRNQVGDGSAEDGVPELGEEPSGLPDSDVVPGHHIPHRDVKSRDGALLVDEAEGEMDFDAFFSAFDDDAPKPAKPSAPSQAITQPVPSRPAPAGLAYLTTTQPPGAIPSPNRPTGAVPRPIVPSPAVPSPTGAVPRPIVPSPAGTVGRPIVPSPSGAAPRSPVQSPGGGIPRPVAVQPSSAMPAPPNQSGAVSVAGRQTGPVPVVARQTGPIPTIGNQGPPERETGGVPVVPPQVRLPAIPRPVAPSQSLPKPPPPPPRPPQTPPIAKPQQPAPQKPPPGMTEADVNALHAKYIQAKQMVGEKVDAGSREKLLKTINQTAPKIMEQYKASGVDFSVVVKDNQVVIKAKPKT